MAGEAASIPAVTLDQATAPKSIEETIAEYKIDDEFKALIPPLSKDELAMLKESISKNGCLDPLIIWKGQGIILDGQNRYQICKDLGLPFKVVEIDLPDRTAAKIWILHHQRGRRNLNEAQRAMLAVKLEALYAEKAKERQGLRTDLDQNLDQSDAGRSAEKAAKDMGVSHQTVSFAKKVTIKGIPDLIRLAESGKVAVSAAAKVTAFDEESQVKIVESIEAEINKGNRPKLAAIIRAIAPKTAKDDDAGKLLEKSKKNLTACLKLLEGVDASPNRYNLAAMKEMLQKITEKLAEIEANSPDLANQETAPVSSDQQDEVEHTLQETSLKDIAPEEDDEDEASDEGPFEAADDLPDSDKTYLDPSNEWEDCWDALDREME